MVVFGGKSSSAKTKLFEQPLDKLLSPKTVRQLNEAMRRTRPNQVGLRRRYYANKIEAQIDASPNSDEDECYRVMSLNVLPEPIKRLLAELYAKGPCTVGIFRKSPNAKHCKELRQKLESAEGLDFIADYQVTVIASVFKEWLRSLPDCLLMSRLYPQWIDTAKLIEPLHLDKMRRQQLQQQDNSAGALFENTFEMLNGGQRKNSDDIRLRNMLSMTQFELKERHNECIRIIRQLLDALNETNLILLRAIMCVLWHIAKNSEQNKMCSNNLGVCVGQSLLNDEHQQKKNRRSSSLGLATSMNLSSNLNTSASPASSTLKQISSSTFAKRHRRARSHCLLSSTLSLTNLSSQLSLAPSSYAKNSSTSNLKHNNCLTNQFDSDNAQEAAKYVPILVAFMIDNAEHLFGPKIVNLFGSTKPESNTMSAPPLEVKALSDTSSSSQMLHVDDVNHRTSLEDRNDVVGLLASRPTNQSMVDDNLSGSSRQAAESLDDYIEDSKLIQRQSSQAETNRNTSMIRDCNKPTKQVSITNPVKDGQLNIRKHQRKPSMSFITVQIGGYLRNAKDSMILSSTPSKSSSIDQQDQPDVSPIASSGVASADSCSMDTDGAGTATSILIVNSPKRPQPTKHQQEERPTGGRDNQSNNCSISYGRMESQPTSLSCEATSDGPISIGLHNQQRPLSAAESTTSSSRASSSTSGVHSESPAFSNESDNHQVCHDHHQHRGVICTSSRSLSTSISSPGPTSSSSPSICTSPNVDELDTMNGISHSNHLNQIHVEPNQENLPYQHEQESSHLNVNDDSTSISIGQDSRFLLLQKRCRDSTDGQQDAIVLSKPRNNERTKRADRPKSMVDLYNHENIFSQMSQQQQQYNVRQFQDQQPQSQSDYVNFVSRSSTMKNSHEKNRNQTFNRYSRACHPLMFDRMPKIPFQYTTSCYGGEAVLYYPSNAYLSQQQQQQQPCTLRMGCNRIQSLDRENIYNQVQRNLQQTPQRSHVTMLRDYYLSLQEQNQQHRTQLFDRQHNEGTNTTAINTNHQHHKGQQQHLKYPTRQQSTSQQTVIVNQHSENPPQSLQSLKVSQHAPPSTITRFSGFTNDLFDHTSNINTMHTDNQANPHQNEEQQQPINAKFAYQRVRPRMAKIRQNQFNGLYVKRASSPHMITGDCTESLIVHPINDMKPTTACAPSKSGNGMCTSNFMKISRLSLSQQSSKMSSSSNSTEQSTDEESDDCSAGEWMESTLV